MHFRPVLLPVAVALLLLSACDDTSESPDASPSTDASAVIDGGADGGNGADAGAEDAALVDAEPNACGDLQPCGGACVDTAGDNLNCGACGTACDAAEICVSGACASADLQCAGRILGSVGDGVTIEASTIGMGDDIDGLCRRSGTDEDITLYWRVPVGGQWDIRFGSEDFDVVASASLLALPGSCQGNELACDDDGNGPNGAHLSFEAYAGQDVLISVDAFRGTGSGTFTMAFGRSGEEPVSNGDCDNAGDRAYFSRGLNIFAAFACFARECAQSPDAPACVGACVQGIIPPGELSEACSGCFGDYTRCVIDNCGADCMHDTNCEDCDYDGLCGAPFGECSGL